MCDRTACALARVLALVALATVLGAPGPAVAASFAIALSPDPSVALSSTNYANGDHSQGLSALNAVGQPASAATGGEIGLGITYDDLTNVLSYNVGYGSDFGFTDLAGDFTVAHIHGPVAVQFPSANTGAGIVVALTHSAGSSGRTGSFQSTATLSEAQEAQLFDNLFYINVHSSFAGGGEIRGQLVPVVPEPATGLLMAAGVVVAAHRRTRAS